MNRILRYIKDNGSPVFILELVKRFCSRLRGFAYRRIFIARPGEIGFSAYIRGLSAIKIDRGFRCGKMLWLEALHEYRSMAHLPSIQIGRDVSLSNNVHISCICLISIGDNVLIGSNVFIGDHGHGRYDAELPCHPDIPPADRLLHSHGPVIIEDRVWIGDGVVICGGVKIGSGALIGANSVVIKNIPPNSIAVGAPARVIKSYSADEGWIRSGLVTGFRHE
jgi:acetyltransferase-like isoleucine patch superfamily enzyme